MAKRRLGRYWSSNEKDVMRKLGLRPVPGSGSGELLKEDGENDYILCQLKSTEATSIKVVRMDVEKLLYHSELDNKIPVFAIQFMDGPMLLATVPEELGNIASYLNEDLFTRKSVEMVEIPKQAIRKKVKASERSMEDIVDGAKDNIDMDEHVLPEASEDDDYISQAMAKRKERKNKEKEKSKWQRR